MATIKFWQEMQKVVTIDGQDKLMIGKNSTGEAMYVNMEDINQFLSIVGTAVKPIPGGPTEETAVVLQPNASGQTREMNNVIGWFKNPTGSAWEAPENSINTNWWDGSTWSLGSSIPIPMPQGVEVIDPTGQQIPNEKAVADYSVAKTFLLDGINQYNYLDDINGFYINATTGALVPNATSSVSKIYPATSGEKMWIGNRTGNSGVRYINASGQPLAPLDINGNPFTEPGIYQSSYLNGGYTAPDGTVGKQVTTGYIGVNNRQNMSITNTQNPVIKVKKELLPVTDFDQETRDISQNNKNKLDVITSNENLVRKNSGENTLSPQYFKSEVQPAAPSPSFGTNIVNDTDSPYKDILKYKRVLYNNRIANKATCFKEFRIDIGSERPTSISFSFWCKTSELIDIWKNYSFVSYFGFTSFNFSSGMQRALAGETITVIQAAPPVEYSSAKGSLSIVETNSLWSRVEINFFDIVWRPEFTGTSIGYYFTFTFADFLNKTLDLCDFTILFNQQAKAGVLYGDPNGAFSSNISTLKGLENEIININKRIDNLDSGLDPLDLELLGNRLYVSSKYNNTQRIVQVIDIKRDSSFTNNPNVNMVNEYLIPNGSDLKIPVTIVKGSSDDICPANLNINNAGLYNYIGGNHSWNAGRLITKTGIGKTLQDVGAIYKDSVNNEFVIGRWVDVNSIWLFARNKALDGYYNFPAPSGDLTYVSNGVNNSTISGYTSNPIPNGNAYTVITPSEVTVKIDGVKPLVVNGVYKANYIDVNETYNMLDMPSIIEDLILKRPLGGYTNQPLLNSLNSNKLLKHSISYRYTSNGVMLISTSFNVLNFNNINLNFHGFTQAIALTTGFIYVPKSKPIVVGDKTWNLSIPEAWTVAPTAGINLTPEYWELPDSPPDRVINYNSTTVFHTGYLTDRGVGLDRKNKVNNSMFLATSRKMYPMGYSKPGIMSKNSYLSCVAFRSFTDPSLNPLGRTSFTWFELNNEIFIYLDYHGSLIDEIKADSSWVGRKIQIYESRGDVQVLSDIVSSNIMINSYVVSGNYGFVVLKLV